LARNDEANHEATKNGMNADDAGEEGGNKSKQKNQGNDTLRWPMLEAAFAAQ
jgi:hypothetical protein